MKINTTKPSIMREVFLIKIKDAFEKELRSRLNLELISSPLYLPSTSGLNDNLNGAERPVSFELNGEKQEIIHSLAKWKRWYLGKLGAEVGQGIVCNMTAIRADEVKSILHSHLVEQWDWEKVITYEDRTLETLISAGRKVFLALKEVEKWTSEVLQIAPSLPPDIKVIHSQQLLNLYPDYTAKERENEITEKYGAVLLIGIGNNLTNGEPHDLRAPDYDDWISENLDGYKGLNADLLVWNPALKMSVEISSMGIRVDENSLIKQLVERKAESRINLPFHQMILNKKLPYTVGGGIGQSRVVMFLTKMEDIALTQPSTKIDRYRETEKSILFI